MKPPTSNIPSQTIFENFGRAIQSHLAEQPFSAWPSGEKPLERLFSIGIEGLSDIEIIALMLDPKTKPNPMVAAEQLFAFCGNNWAGVQRVKAEHLQTIIRKADAARIAAAMEMYRRILAESIERKQIRSPTDAAQLMMAEMSHLDQEHLRIICLDTKNRIQKTHTLYVGTVNSSNIRIGEVFKEAIRLNSVSIIVCHNHPSGDPTPSPEDVQVTRQIVEAGKLLDIEALDHLIIGQGRFVSLRERGLGFA